MVAKYVLAGLGCVFLIAGLASAAMGRSRPQARTWLLVGVIFLLVSLWLFTLGSTG
jgi:hypothetical protein